MKGGEFGCVSDYQLLKRDSATLSSVLLLVSGAEARPSSLSGTYIRHIVHGSGHQILRAVSPLCGQGSWHPHQQLGRRPDLQVTTDS